MVRTFHGSVVFNKPTSITVSEDAVTLALPMTAAAFDGNPVNSQSPSGVVVDGNTITITITLGTAIVAGSDATVRYFPAAAANALRDTDGTPVTGFTITLTTTQRD
ncbi:hypothetical protein [Candidatus Poriferisodalis sp.]|uniref:hypothetical protein n=1 Tax=Candidatus Poriferisodalis sp. TaxID=3101277 RepID=UPI003B020DC4